MQAQISTRTGLRLPMLQLKYLHIISGNHGLKEDQHMYKICNTNSSLVAALGGHRLMLGWVDSVDTRGDTGGVTELTARAIVGVLFDFNCVVSVASARQRLPVHRLHIA